MSKIAIIGGSGNVGAELVSEALRRHREVTAIARDPSKRPQRVGLTLKALDLRDSHALKDAITGSDVVVTSVEFDGLNPNAIILPIVAATVPRLIVVGGAASLNISPGQR